MVTKAEALVLAPFIEARYPEMKKIKEQIEKTGSKIPSDLDSQLLFASNVFDLAKQITPQSKHEKPS